MLADNPCKGIERNGEDKRKRYMVGDEPQRPRNKHRRAPDRWRCARQGRLFVPRRTTAAGPKHCQYELRFHSGFTARRDRKPAFGMAEFGVLEPPLRLSVGNRATGFALV